MPNPNAIVSNVVRFNPPIDRSVGEMLRATGGLSVELEGDNTVRFDPDDPRSVGFAQILDGMRTQGMPVYLEIDPDTSTISSLHIPHVARVVGIRELEDDTLGIELEISHGLHVLKRESPDFDELELQLRKAVGSQDRIVLTENDAHEIIDVREYHPGEKGPPRRSLLKLEPISKQSWVIRGLKKLLHILSWCWWPWWWPFCWIWWLRCVSQARAQQVFDSMSATSCDPLTVPAPCIPFLYPDDGCWARAHEMTRLMIEMNLRPKKVWIQGSLRVSTPNNPNCEVRWGWHVAPTLCVRGPCCFQRRRMVIDPSLFTAPVTKTTWKGIQGDTSATLTDSSASIYYLWGNVTDPAYSETNYYLAYYRLQLQSRSVQVGPPPYANCL